MKDVGVHVALLLVQVMFGTLPLTGQKAMEGISPMGLATLRIVGAAIVFSAVAGRKLGSVRWRDLPWIALLAGLGVVGNQVLFLQGLSRSTQINASILVSTIPVFTVAFAILLGKEKARWVRILGVLVGLAGALVLSGVERLDFSDELVMGNLMVLTNAACWSLHLVLARPFVQRTGPLVLSAWMFIFGSVAMIPFGAGPVIAAVGEASRLSWAAAAWAVAVPTVAAYFVNLWALRRVEASYVAVYVYLQPVVAGTLAWLVVGEVPTLRTGIAALLIFVGVGIVATVRPEEPE